MVKFTHIDVPECGFEGGGILMPLLIWQGEKQAQRYEMPHSGPIAEQGAQTLCFLIFFLYALWCNLSSAPVHVKELK